MSNAPDKLIGGRYRMEKRIGKGGFGAVYLAHDTRLSQPVALKRNLIQGSEAHRQFEAEAKILAALRHENLPRVIDHLIEDRKQYLVMEYIEGDSLQKLLEDRGKPFSEKAVVYFGAKMCDALECLHSQTPPIIHRDIKPGNIIVAPSGERVVLVDFGIFKRHDPTASTVNAARAVTPGYSPPEQYGVGHTDPRSDIYALGATLYTLLTGRVPEESVDLHFRKQRVTPIRHWNPTISLALESAVTQALELNLDRRPQNVAQFRALLEAARPNWASYVPPIPVPPRPAPQPVRPRPAPQPARPRPVSSKPPQPTWEQVMGASVVLIALLFVGWFLFRPESGTRLAAPVMPPAPIGADNAAGVVELQRWGSGVIYEFAYSPDGSLVAVASTMGVYLYNATTMAEVRRFTDLSSAITSLAFAPDGRTVAAGSMDGRIYSLPIAGGQVEEPLTAHASWITALVFTDDGTMLVSASGDGSIRLWQTADGSPVTTLAENSVASQLALSADGQTLAAAMQDGSIRLWQIELGAFLRTLPAAPSPAQSVAFQPSNSGLLAAGHDDGQVRLWRWAEGAPVGILHVGDYPVNSIVFAPDGASLVTGTADGRVRQWGIVDGREMRAFGSHTGPVNTLAFTSDGQRLASSSGDDTVRQWNVVGGTALNTAAGYGGWVHGVAFRPGGMTVVSAHGDGSVVLNSPDGTQLPLSSGHTDAARSLAIAPSGLIAASGGADKKVVLWQLSDGEVVRTFEGHKEQVNSVAFSPDSATVATLDDKTVRIWHVADGDEVDSRSLESPGRVVAFAPDGAIIAAALDDGSIWVWRWQDVTTIATLKYDSQNPIRGLTFTPGGNELITIWDGKSADRWTLPNGSRQIIIILDAPTISLALSPDGQTLAIGSETGRIWLLRAADGTPLKDLDGHMGRVNSLAFSSDGTRLASGGADGTVRLWGVGQ